MTVTWQARHRLAPADAEATALHALPDLASTQRVHTRPSWRVAWMPEDGERPVVATVVLDVRPPKDILRLVTRLNVGGPARHALLLTRDLHPEYPTLLCAGRPDAAEGELRDPAVAVRRVPLVRPPHPFHDARALAVVRNLLGGGRFGLVHTHMAKAGAVGRLAAQTVTPRPRTVHTFHGHVLDGYFPSTVQRIFAEAERRLARRTDVLVAVSAEVRDALLALGVGRPGQFEVIPLGLDLDPFLQVSRPSGTLRSQLGLSPHVALVGVVARLVAIKDHATLLDAFTRLPAAHLAVIGDGELRAPLEEQARTAGMAHRVHFTGWLRDVPAALSDLDLVVLASRNEGTPVALIEALAAGCPAVATDVGGVRSVVVDGQSGRLTPPGDPVALARAVEHLLADPGLRRGMGQHGRQHVRSRFGRERLLADMRALYSAVLAPAPARL